LVTGAVRQLRGHPDLPTSGPRLNLSVEVPAHRAPVHYGSVQP
jgi:hypothetical protein